MRFALGDYLKAQATLSGNHLICPGDVFINWLDAANKCLNSLLNKDTKCNINSLTCAKTNKRRRRRIFKLTFLVSLRVHFFGKILIRILNPKTDFMFLWQNQKRDYESSKSVRDEDSMD